MLKTYFHKSTNILMQESNQTNSAKALLPCQDETLSNRTTGITVLYMSQLTRHNDDMLLFRTEYNFHYAIKEY